MQQPESLLQPEQVPLTAANGIDPHITERVAHMPGLVRLERVVQREGQITIHDQVIEDVGERDGEPESVIINVKATHVVSRAGAEPAVE